MDFFERGFLEPTKEKKIAQTSYRYLSLFSFALFGLIIRFFVEGFVNIA